MKWGLIGILALSACTINCFQPCKNTTPATPVDPAALTFDNVYENVLVPSCVGCHGGGRSSGGFSIDSYTEVMKKVVAGDAKASNLYYVLSVGSMPPGGPAVPQDLVQMVQDWIDQGAKEK